jgi:hypothetical protein
VAGCWSDGQNDVGPMSFADVGLMEMLTLGQHWADINVLSGNLLFKIVFNNLIILNIAFLCIFV